MHTLGMHLRAPGNAPFTTWPKHPSAAPALAKVQGRSGTWWWACPISNDEAEYPAVPALASRASPHSTSDALLEPLLRATSIQAPTTVVPHSHPSPAGARVALAPQRSVGSTPGAGAGKSNAGAGSRPLVTPPGATSAFAPAKANDSLPFPYRPAPWKLKAQGHLFFLLPDNLLAPGALQDVGLLVLVTYTDSPIGQCEEWALRRHMGEDGGGCWCCVGVWGLGMLQ